MPKFNVTSRKVWASPRKSLDYKEVVVVIEDCKECVERLGVHPDLCESCDMKGGQRDG